MKSIGDLVTTFDIKRCKALQVRKERSTITDPKWSFILFCYEIVVLFRIQYGDFISFTRVSPKVSLYFGNMRPNLTAVDAFIEVVKVKNHCGLRNAELVWYSPSTTLRICIYSLVQDLEIYGFMPTRHCLIDEFLATRAKFVINFYFHPLCKAMPCVSAHQLPQYNQL